MPRCFHSSTASRQARSSSSSTAGVSPRRVIWATACPEETRLGKAPMMVRGVPASAGRSRSVTSVTTPSVPSDPTNRPTRSSPATPLVVRRRQPDRVAVGDRPADDRAQAEHVIAGDAVLQAAQAARVGGHVAADRGPRCAGRVRRVPQSVLGHRRLAAPRRPGCPGRSPGPGSIRDRSRMTQLPTAFAPPDRPVPAPRGTIGAPSSAQARTTCCTSASVRARTPATAFLAWAPDSASSCEMAASTSGSTTRRSAGRPRLSASTSPCPAVCADPITRP